MGYEDGRSSSSGATLSAAHRAWVARSGWPCCSHARAVSMQYRAYRSDASSWWTSTWPACSRAVALSPRAVKTPML